MKFKYSVYWKTATGKEFPWKGVEVNSFNAGLTKLSQLKTKYKIVALKCEQIVEKKDDNSTIKNVDDYEEKA